MDKQTSVPEENKSGSMPERMKQQALEEPRNEGPKKKPSGAELTRQKTPQQEHCKDEQSHKAPRAEGTRRSPVQSDQLKGQDLKKLQATTSTAQKTAYVEQSKLEQPQGRAGGASTRQMMPQEQPEPDVAGSAKLKSAEASNQKETQKLPNGDGAKKSANAEPTEQKTSQPGQAKGEDAKKLSGAELKKQQKAEKQARRAAEKAASGAPNGTAVGESAVQSQDAGSAQQQKGKGQQQPSQQKGEAAKKQGKPAAQDGESHHKRSPSQQQSFPLRAKQSESSSQKAPKQDNKQVQLLSHLYTGPRRHTLEGASKDIHPTVLALGLQISSYEICGSSARCVAMLLAFKECIQAYTTPAGTSLARHMVGHYLSPQIEYLKSCRPISESMGNAIRWLKKLVIAIDPSTPEAEAKSELCDRIDTFIRERITVTDQAIAASAARLIRPGSVVLTFAKSSIVEKTILEAHTTLGSGSFRVVVVDSRPLFEGKTLATTLMHAGLEVEYLPFSALAHAVQSATVVLLGAHSMLSNGRLQSRVGTAALAMQAHRADVPVIVCCESVKFSGKVALDSIVLNEIAPEEELFLPQRQEGGGKEGEGSVVKGLKDFREVPNLQILNLMYDVTPAEYIRMVICEYGSLPPSSVPVVHRLANDE